MINTRYINFLFNFFTDILNYLSNKRLEGSCSRLVLLFSQILPLSGHLDVRIKGRSCLGTVWIEGHEKLEIQCLFEAQV